MVRRLTGCLLPLALAGAAALPASAQQTQPEPDEQQLIEQIQQMRESVQGGAAPAEEAAPAGEPPPELDEAAVAELKQRLTSNLGVDVLDVRPIEADGRQAYAVKVMNPGGNSNDAFLVSTLVVDRDSGEVLGQLPQSIGTAADFSGSGARFQPNVDASGPVIRRRTYR